jgi:hypothetical protein
MNEKYKFDDFTIDKYKSILELAKLQNKPFVFFNELKGLEKFIIWRHDVDISLKGALEFAKIEKEYEIKATYFFLLTSEYYSLFEKNSMDILRKIRDLGHRIGIHFDPSVYNNKEIKKT